VQYKWELTEYREASRRRPHPENGKLEGGRGKRNEVELKK